MGWEWDLLGKRSHIGKPAEESLDPLSMICLGKSQTQEHWRLGNRGCDAKLCATCKGITLLQALGPLCRRIKEGWRPTVTPRFLLKLHLGGINCNNLSLVKSAGFNPAAKADNSGSSRPYLTQVPTTLMIELLDDNRASKAPVIVTSSNLL